MLRCYLAQKDHYTVRPISSHASVLRATLSGPTRRSKQTGLQNKQKGKRPSNRQPLWPGLLHSVRFVLVYVSDPAATRRACLTPFRRDLSPIHPQRNLYGDEARRFMGFHKSTTQRVTCACMCSVEARAGIQHACSLAPKLVRNDRTKAAPVRVAASHARALCYCTTMQQ